MEEIEEFLFGGNWSFRFDWISKKTYGDMNPRTMDVRINVRLMIIETLFHEFYHTKFPRANEAQVEKMAQAKVQSLTVSEIFNLTDRFVAIWARGG